MGIAGNYVNDNTLTVYIKRIRAKLSPNDIIKTIKGMAIEQKTKKRENFLFSREGYVNIYIKMQ